MAAELEKLIPSKGPKQVGLTERLCPVREQYCKSVYIKDLGALPPNTTYRVRETCGRLHPGVCKCDLNDDISAVYQQVGNACDAYLVGILVSLVATCMLLGGSPRPV